VTEPLQGPSAAADAWCTREPHFYVLGSKSFGRRSDFLLPYGHQQIRDLFALMGGRSDLNLYANLEKLQP